MDRQGSPPILTRAESSVMRVLWRLGRGTVHDVLGGLDQPLAYTTVLTVLRVLEKKGYVTHAANPEGGRMHLFSPAVPEERARRLHLRDLLDRLFGGRAEALVVGLLDEEDLTDADLQALRARIDERLKGAGHRTSGTSKRGRS